MSTVIIRKEKCNNGLPASRCNWEMVLIKSGLQIDKAGSLSDMNTYKNMIELWGLMQ